MAKRTPFFHRHGDWQVVGERYNPPSKIVPGSSVKGTSQDVDIVLHGFTLITQRCGGYGWTTADRVPGRTQHAMGPANIG